MEKLKLVIGTDSITDQANVLLVAGEVDLETHLDYLHFAHDHEADDYSVYDVAAMEQQLSGDDLPVEEKKRLMGILAHMGTPAAFRLLETCFRDESHKMKSWISLALMECKMFLEVHCNGDDHAEKE